MASKEARTGHSLSRQFLRAGLAIPWNRVDVSNSPRLSGSVDLRSPCLAAHAGSVGADVPAAKRSRPVDSQRRRRARLGSAGPQWRKVTGASIRLASPRLGTMAGGGTMGDFWTFSGIDGSQPALIIPGSATLTYEMLSAAADEWLAKLRTAAGRHVPLVAIEFTNSPDAIAAYLGVLRAGFPLLIVEPGKIGADSQMAQVWRPDLQLVAAPAGRTILRERRKLARRMWRRCHRRILNCGFCSRHPVAPASRSWCGCRAGTSRQTLTRSPHI